MLDISDAQLAPILLFAYNRLDSLTKTVTSLKHNSQAIESDLYIYSDAAKNETGMDAVLAVRDYLKTIEGFKKIVIVEAEKNIGLANSIIGGVTEIINQYGKVIVLEDDLLLSPNFLTFMNASLDLYEKNEDVFSVSGFIFDIPNKPTIPYDVFFTKRHCSWGWAMWKDRWNEIDWEVSDFDEFVKSPSMQREFNKIGSDLTDSLIRQQKGEINSWAIRCNYSQFKKQTYTVYPLLSKVKNIGFSAAATHTTQRFNKYKATLEDKPNYKFTLPDEIFEDPFLMNAFQKKYSKRMRIYYYLLNKIFK